MKTSRIAPILLLVLVTVGGCVQQPATDPGAGRVVRTGNGQGPDALPGASGPNPLDAFDPLGSRLHDIGGMVIQFYGMKQRMPASLDELKTIAGPVPAADFQEPGTGKPFVYLPQAARMTGGDKRVVCYAPTPAVSKDGSAYYQALLVQAGRPGQLSASWVVTLSALELQGHTASLAPPMSQPFR